MPKKYTWFKPQISQRCLLESVKDEKEGREDNVQEGKRFNIEFGEAEKKKGNTKLKGHREAKAIHFHDRRTKENIFFVFKRIKGDLSIDS